jgi:hypothetical protein
MYETWDLGREVWVVGADGDGIDSADGRVEWGAWDGGTRIGICPRKERQGLRKG